MHTFENFDPCAATGEHLDTLAMRRGIERGPGETDDALRARVLADIRRIVENAKREWEKEAIGHFGVGRTHTTQAGESVAGIALRQLGDEKRWRKIAALNDGLFPDMGPNDYYPVGTVLKLPAV